MDFYGEEVMHKSFGKGVVVPDPNGSDKNGQYICVEFERDETKRIFPFTDSFIAGWLQTESPKINLHLNNAIKNSTCVKCRKPSKEVDVKNGKLYCRICLGLQVQCCDCGQYIPKADAVVDSGNCFCRACYRQLTFTCGDCGNVFLRSTQGRPTYGDNRFICDDCAAEYSECYFCEKLIKEDQSRDIQYKTLCPECYAQYVKKCAQCGEEFVDEEGNRDICYTCFAQKHYRESLSADFNQAIIKWMPFSVFRQYNDCVRLMTKVACGQNKYRNRYTSNKELADRVIDYLVLTGSMYSLVLTSRVECKMGWQKYGGITLTELKRVGIQYILQYQRKQKCHKIPFVNGKQLYVWEWPYTLRAVSHFDTDYGFNRNQWGDTSDFYIIGYLQNP